MTNRSVPVSTVLPHVYYSDIARAIEWLTRVFGFTEHYRYGDPAAPQGAQMRAGNAYIMLAGVRSGRTTPALSGHATQSLTIFVDDPDAHCARAKSAGAAIVEELNDTMYGDRQYAALDCEGRHWLFSRHARDVSPDEWGAVLAPTSPE